MIQETGTLPIGVNYQGARRREFILRPLQVRDSMAIRKGPEAERALSDDELMGLALLGRRLTIEGVPEEFLTLARMEQFWDDDLAEVMVAEGRLSEQLARFRGKTPAEVDAGAVAGGDTVAGGEKDAGGGSGVLDRGLGGAQDAEGEAGPTFAGEASP